jgi:hypothetical protein
MDSKNDLAKVAKVAKTALPPTDEAALQTARRATFSGHSPRKSLDRYAKRNENSVLVFLGESLNPALPPF